MWKTGNMKCFTCAQLSPGDQHWAGVSAWGDPGIPCLTVRYFIALHRYYVDYKLVCDNPVLSKSVAAILPIAFAHCMSLSHFDNSRNVSNFSIVLIFVMGSVIHDLWCDNCKKIRTC